MRIIALLICLLFAYNVFAFEVSVDEENLNRVYVGEDKTVDWVDVGKVYDKNFNCIFEDLSYIETIYKIGNMYEINKKNSMWILLWDRNPIEIVLKLISPVIGKNETKYLIYKRR